MIRNCSLWKFKEGTTPETVAEIVAALRKLPEEIDLVRGISVGADIGDRPGNYDMALMSDFDSFEDYATYREHPAHLRVAEELLIPNIEDLSDRVAVQYEL